MAKKLIEVIVSSKGKVVIETLEGRRLMTTVFQPVSLGDDGHLQVVGTNLSEKISIVNAVQSTNSVLASGASGLIGYLVVTIDGRMVGRFKANQVKEIDVYANGGNDRVTGPDGTIAIQYAKAVLGSYTPRAINMLIEGGSGNDRIVGGAGDDVLIGGRGNDTLTDVFGKNRLNGGQGDDTIHTIDDANDVTFGDFAPSPDVLIGGPGKDTFKNDYTDLITDGNAEDVYTAVLGPTIIN